jgi:ATP-binding cassette, subfamily B, bacterial PglK
MPLKKILFLFTKSQRNSAAFLLVLMAVGMMLETLGIGLVVPAITLMMQSNSSETGAEPTIASALIAQIEGFGFNNMVVIAIVLLVTVYLLKNLFLAFLFWKQTRFTFAVQAEISQRLFATYMNQPYTFHLQRNSAELIRNVSGEVTLFTTVLNAAMLILTEGLVTIGIALLLMLIEPMGALIVIVVLGGASWGFYTITRARITRWGEERQHHDGLKIQHLQQGLGGIKDVLLLGRQNEFLRAFSTHNQRYAQVGERQNFLQQLPRLWLECLAILGLAILVFSMLSRGHGVSTILPTIALFSAAAFRLLPSFNRLLNAFQYLRYGRPTINMLYKELNTDIQPTTVESSDSPTPLTQRIDLNNIVYQYPLASTQAITDISITIHKGQCVGFIGTSGAGKSTLVDIILGLLPPTQGSVNMDGHNVQNNLREWQNKIGYVPQSIYLTDDSLLANIAFGLSESEIDNAAVESSIKAAQIDSFINTLPEKMNTVVGERGIRLSGGQRQRIGIARALYHNPQILVLDEATSALDSDTETGVMQAINALHGEKTILIIAHRMSTVMNCDYLFKMENGKIISQGTPEEMLNSEEIPPYLNTQESITS